MEAIFSKLIEQLNSSVFILLAILLISFWMIFKIGKWSQKFIHHDEKLHGFKDLSDRVIKIETTVDLIYQRGNPLLASRSPISLTDIGIEISKKIDADSVFKKYADKLSKEVDLLSPENAYDIQEVAMKVSKEKMANFLTDVELNSIKQEAFTRGLLFEDVMGIFGIFLRNYILSAKGIPVADVDKHAKKT